MVAVKTQVVSVEMFPPSETTALGAWQSCSVEFATIEFVTLMGPAKAESPLVFPVSVECTRLMTPALPAPKIAAPLRFPLKVVFVMLPLAPACT